ncbi:multidrug effflux MFS transporter [Vibrio atypicus]|uniref:multidrug effflux MFS transporter n=1 Tax=Vibrio atypicus TaxID=558271 RepID=UPI003736A97F
MVRKPSLMLMVIMLMVPQIVETIYSPALRSIADTFAVTPLQAAQTLSIYFIAFAIGVVFWGITADKYGRRPAMLLGLFIYSCATLTALVTEHFYVVMLARAASAFGIAVGSVVTQTMLRDSFSGEELGKVFSLMGMGISISPVIGMALGGQLVLQAGYQAVFATLFILAIMLLGYNGLKLPETRQTRQPLQLSWLGKTMFKDSQIWCSATLVATFNIALFAYYQLGGFVFEKLGYSVQEFGYSGLVLGIGTLFGSYCNKALLARKVDQSKLLSLATALLTIGSIGVYFLNHSIWFLVPMLLVVMAFGIAIPNVLSTALLNYRQHVGSAGALLGLMYYLIIGVGLAVAGIIQHLGTVLVVCALLTIVARSLKR